MNTVIETQDISKHYKNVKAVDRLNLQVKKGEIYAFLGLNGAGKTTTIRMLLGMIRPTHGTVHMLGTPVRVGQKESWRSVGHLVEAPHAYPELTVRENLEVARRYHPGTARSAVETIIEELKLSEYADRRTGNLSQGNAQRLGLAKALLHDPEVLLLDEPANGLDPAGVVEIREMLIRLTQENGVTVFMSSHILGEVARLAQRIGIIHQGHLLQEMSMEELARNRKRSLRIQTNDTEKAGRVLASRRLEHEIQAEGMITIFNQAAFDHPEELASLLVKAGCPPRQLILEEEGLEDFFLRLVGLNGGGSHE